MGILTRRKFLLATALLMGPPRMAGAADNPLEYRVKAAFLFNFLKFVEWPESAPATASGTPWVLGVLGRDPFGGILAETVRGKKVNGREVIVRHFAHPADIRDCHILFISSAEFQHSGAFVHAGLLAVGESPGFLDAGGVINFYIEQDRVRFEISPAAARGAGLRIGAQLLKLGSER